MRLRTRSVSVGGVGWGWSFWPATRRGAQAQDDRQRPAPPKHCDGTNLRVRKAQPAFDKEPRGIGVEFFHHEYTRPCRQ